MDRDELLQRLEGAESTDFEVKSAAGGVPEDAFKTVSAFANSSGGWLIFGVQESDGGLVPAGVPDPHRLQNDFLNACRSPDKLSRPVALEAKHIQIDGGQVLACYVPPLSRFDKPLRVRVKKEWQSYVRIGSGDHRCRPEEEARFLRDASYEEYVTTVYEEATIDDLELDAIKWLRGVIGLHDASLAESDMDQAEFLAAFGLLREGRLTRAAALLFGRRGVIAHLQPAGIVDFRVYFDPWPAAARTDWADRVFCDRSIVSALRSLLVPLHGLSPQPFEMMPNGIQHRGESRDYLAVREALINLLVHQDYTDRHRTARILWCRDRVIFENPGDSFLTPKRMLEGASSPRNPLLLQLMRQAGFAEQAGRGIRGIVETWRRAGREDPVIVNDPGEKIYRLELPWKELSLPTGVADPEATGARKGPRVSVRKRRRAPVTVEDRIGLVELGLDRGPQKATAGRAVAELVQSETRRVLALVAYGGAGNAIGKLGDQLRYYLDDKIGIAELTWLRLRFPSERLQLDRDLAAEFRVQLEAELNESVTHLLHRHARRETDEAAIVWLDWGVFGPETEQQEPLSPGQLGAWLRFSSQFLGVHCPDDLRVVSLLALQIEEYRQYSLEQALQEHRRQSWCRTPAFRLSVLPPLGRVAEADLLDFLEDAESCDSGIEAEIAQAVIGESGGEFEPTVALLQEAERGSWYELLARLESRPTGTVRDDEPF